MYKGIKSQYIKDKIKHTRWKDRVYINALARIERLALGIYTGLDRMHAANNLSRVYPTEWEAIWKEINPKGYEEWLEEKEKYDEDFGEYDNSVTKKEKAEWLEMGGLQ